MSIDISVDTNGVDRALQIVERSLSPKSGGGEAVRRVAEIARAYASSITHHWTSTLWKTHTVDESRIASDGIAAVYIERVRNPLGQYTDIYGPKEHAKGGDHAFYDRTVRNRGPFALRQGVSMLERRLNAAWQ